MGHKYPYPPFSPIYFDFCQVNISDYMGSWTLPLVGWIAPVQYFKSGMYPFLPQCSPRWRYFHSKTPPGKTLIPSHKAPKTPKCLAGREGRGMGVLVVDFRGFIVPIIPKWVPDEVPQKISTGKLTKEQLLW